MDEDPSKDLKDTKEDTKGPRPLASLYYLSRGCSGKITPQKIPPDSYVTLGSDSDRPCGDV